MTKKPRTPSDGGVPDAVRRQIEDAERAAQMRPRIADSAFAGDDDDDTGGEPMAAWDGEADPDTVARCAGLDHSDTDNAVRLLAHFGGDLTVMIQEGSEKPPYAVWTGTHWDFGTGPSRALAVAQRLGGCIAMEADLIGLTPDEQKAVTAATDADIDLSADPEDLDAMKKRLLKRAQAARKAHQRRVQRRHSHAVTSKNVGRMRAMLDCAAPHIMRDADDFNADALRFACRTHTIRFERVVTKRRNPAFDDPDDSREDVPEFIEDVAVKVAAQAGHERGDRITTVAPVDYVPGATCPKFIAWLNEFLPDPEVRRMVQVAMGLGLLGVTVQRLFFHYGKGANGKSIFMETIARVLGELAITLPAESITGKAHGAGGGPSPDLARLYGRRLLRVAELPQGEPLRIELIKKLTGGERFPVRDLFKGYFDFTPIFVAHMSGNGYPRTDETDNGTWRRLVVVKWPKTIPTESQRDFEDVMGDFEPEYPGILNWLIDGAKTFLAEGLHIAAESLAETAKYRADMDPLASFIAACVEPAQGEGIMAAEMYAAYRLWASTNGADPITMNSFGRKMKNYFERTEGVRGRTYQNCRLHDVPDGAPGKDDYPDGYGGG